MSGFPADLGLAVAALTFFAFLIALLPYGCTLPNGVASRQTHYSNVLYRFDGRGTDLSGADAVA